MAEKTICQCTLTGRELDARISELKGFTVIRDDSSRHAYFHAPRDKENPVPGYSVHDAVCVGMLKELFREGWYISYADEHITTLCHSDGSRFHANSDHWNVMIAQAYVTAKEYK